MQQTIKKILLILGLLGIFSGCSHMIDAIWNPNTASFNIDALPAGANQIEITFSQDDHSNVRNFDEITKDSYFYGYYIYRNSSSPYDDYDLIGIEGLSALTASDSYDTYHQSFQEKHGLSAPVADSDNNSSSRSYIDTCSTGVKYYYRVVVVYRKWNTHDDVWRNDLEDKEASSWAAETCP